MQNSAQTLFAPGGCRRRRKNLERASRGSHGLASVFYRKMLYNILIICQIKENKNAEIV